MPISKAKRAVVKAKQATAKQFDFLNFCDHLFDFLNNPNVYDAKLIIKSLKRLRE